MSRMILGVLVFSLVVSLVYGGGEEGNSTLLDFFEKKVYEGDKRVYSKGYVHRPCYDLGIVGDDEAILWYLRLLRNEIYARHGRIFSSPELRAFFSQLSWYKPLSVEVQLSELEQRNVSFIQTEEKWYREMIRSRYAEPTSMVNIEELGTYPETYVKEVLLRGTFFLEGGKTNPGPTEFAFTMWEGDPDYPSGFAVSRDGKVAYLLDTFNNRLQIFDLETGRLISSLKVETFRRATKEEVEESKKHGTKTASVLLQ